jgi:hypothetical protein
MLSTPTILHQVFDLLGVGIRNVQLLFPRIERCLMLKSGLQTVIEVFIGKSAWHANYVNAFMKIADEETEFPEMRDWLDSDPEQVH